MIRWPAVLALVLAAASVRADPAAPLPPAEQQSLEAFAAAHATCREWSDGCAVYRRGPETGFACSTPGIACQPQPLKCRDSEPAAVPALAPKSPQ